VEDLATAVLNIFKSKVEKRVIGCRHGEKIYETLVTREELLRSNDMGDYYRVWLDDRDLNYTKYFTEGNVEEAKVEDYTSHNTRQLSVKEVEELLLSLPEVTCEM
jgi:UDP-glucose 4-epimerase